MKQTFYTQTLMLDSFKDLGLLDTWNRDSASSLLTLKAQKIVSSFVLDPADPLHYLSISVLLT